MTESSHESRPLPVRGFAGTPEEIERQWYEQVYDQTLFGGGG